MRFWWCALAALAALAAAEDGDVPRWEGACDYDVQSTTQLSAATAGADVALRLAGRLRVEAEAEADDEEGAQWLRFTLSDVELLRRGVRARSDWTRRASPWARWTRAGAAAHARWHAGRLSALRLAPDLPAPTADYLRALVSLFQYRASPGRRAETDVSGACDATYEPAPPPSPQTDLRKIKARCEWEGDAWEARRVSRYTPRAVGGAAPERVFAEEVLWPAAARRAALPPGAAPALRARSLHELSLRECRASPPPPPVPSKPAPLAMLLPTELDSQSESLDKALERAEEALGGWEAGAGGTAAQARALPALLVALRAADDAELRAVLQAAGERRRGLLRALGLAGGEAAWAAARALLAPAARDASVDLAEVYFAGLALSEAPHASVAADALRLGAAARLPGVAHAALLAGAAAAGGAAREPLLAGLARCADAACRELHAAALGNARDAAAAGALLAAAERGGDAAEHALGAMRALPLAPDQTRRLLELAANSSLGLTERALALELGAASAARAPGLPLGAMRLASALSDERGAAAQELRRVLHARMESLGAADWRAAAGTSLVLRRAPGWAAAGRGAALDAALLASRGVLRRARVALQADAAPGEPHTDLLAVEVWTSGLEALAGAGAEAEAGAGAEAEELGASLRVSVLGAALPPLTLFSGQAALLALVWSGAGSSPTPVTRALLPASGAAAVAPLQAGVPLRARWSAAGALALDARGEASLWYRTARAGLALRAAGTASVALELGARDTGELRAEAELEAEPRLTVDVDLDFYETVALCGRVSSAPHAVAWRAQLTERDAAGEGRRRRGASLAAAGRTLSLGRASDAACRALGARDPEPDT